MMLILILPLSSSTTTVQVIIDVIKYNNTSEMKNKSKTLGQSLLGQQIEKSTTSNRQTTRHCSLLCYVVFVGCAIQQ